MKMSSVGGASGPPMKGAPMKDVGQLGGGLPVQGGGPADGAALVQNPQLQSVLQSLIQALTSLSSLIAARAGTSTGAASGGATAVPAGASAVPAVATSTVPVGSVVTNESLPHTH